jgi:hypothetical protein
MERRPPVTSLMGLYAAYLLGAFLMLAALLAYLQAKGLRGSGGHRLQGRGGRGPPGRPGGLGRWKVKGSWLWRWGLDAIGGALVGVTLLWALANVPVGR